MNKKKFVVSLQNRVYLPGVHLAEQGIKQIHILEKKLKEQFRSLTEKELIIKISVQMKLDKRTVEKYLHENSTILVGGRRKRHNDEIKEVLKVNTTFNLEYHQTNS